MFPTRRRKRGTRVVARPYRHHIALRLTYYEAEVLHRVMKRPDIKLDDVEARKAFNRLKTKAATAAALTPPWPKYCCELCGDPAAEIRDEYSDADNWCGACFAEQWPEEAYS